jgi:integrase
VAGKRRLHPRVHIEWDPRRVNEMGLTYALLRWVEDGTKAKEPIDHVTPEQAEELRADKEAEIRARRLGLIPTSSPSSQPARAATVADAVLHYLVQLPTMPGKPDHHRWERTRSLHLDRLLGPVALDKLTASRLKGYVSKRKGEPNEPRKRGDPERRRRNGDRVKALPPASTAGPRRITVFNEVCCLRRIVKAFHEAGQTTVTTLPRAKELFAGWEEDHRPARRLTETEITQLINAGTYVTPSGSFAGTDRSWVGRLIGFLAWCPRRPVAVFGVRIRDCAKAVDASLPRSARLLWVERDKGGKGRGWSPLTAPALGFLVEQVEARVAAGAGPDDLVWVTELGNEWTAQKWWRVVQNVAARAGLEDVTTYDLRKFGAAQVYRRKPNLKVVMQYSGHKNPAVLLRNYIFPDKDEAEEAAETIGWSKPVVRLVQDAPEEP